MRVIVIGLGIQGKKRRAVAGAEVQSTVDPVVPEADFSRLEDVPLGSFDAALVCTPDDSKSALLRYLLGAGKHVLVEKPLLAADEGELRELQDLAKKNNAVCYTAYNHRFEPHIAEMREIILSGVLGAPFLLKIFYGNGTARDVRNSPWRDQGPGVIPDLASHMLDMVYFLFGPSSLPGQATFELSSVERFENRAPDYFFFGTKSGEPRVQLEGTLLSWRNTFRFDLFAAKGSAHIDCLCKWGPSTLTLRKRVLPSGRPDEESRTLVQPDPTWELEYEHFKKRCRDGKSNIENDIWLVRHLNTLGSCAR